MQEEVLSSTVSVLEDEEQYPLDATACSLTEEDVGLTMGWPSNTKNEDFNHDEGLMQHCDCFADLIA